MLVPQLSSPSTFASLSAAAGHHLATSYHKAIDIWSIAPRIFPQGSLTRDLICVMTGKPFPPVPARRPPNCRKLGRVPSMALANLPARTLDTSPRTPALTTALGLVLALMPPALMVVAGHPHPKPSHCPKAAPMPAVPSGCRPVARPCASLNQAMRLALPASANCVTFTQAIATTFCIKPLKG